MNRHSVRGCKTSKQFMKAVHKQGGYTSEGSKHTVVHTTMGKGRVPIPRHTGQLPTGTRSSIKNMLLKLGFVCFPFICVLGTSLIIIGTVK